VLPGAEFLPHRISPTAGAANAAGSSHRSAQRSALTDEGLLEGVRVELAGQVAHHDAVLVHGAVADGRGLAGRALGALRGGLALLDRHLAAGQLGAVQRRHGGVSVGDRGVRHVRVSAAPLHGRDAAATRGDSLELIVSGLAGHAAKIYDLGVADGSGAAGRKRRGTRWGNVVRGKRDWSTWQGR
jgi:hypothetical protein